MKEVSKTHHVMVGVVAILVAGVSSYQIIAAMFRLPLLETHFFEWLPSWWQGLMYGIGMAWGWYKALEFLSGACNANAYGDAALQAFWSMPLTIAAFVVLGANRNAWGTVGTSFYLFLFNLIYKTVEIRRANSEVDQEIDPDFFED